MTFDKVSELNYFLLRDQPSVGASYGKLDIDNILFIIILYRQHIWKSLPLPCIFLNYFV